MKSWSPIGSWFRRGQNTKTRKSVAFRRRLTLEYLEDRTVFSTGIHNSLPVLPAHPRAPSQPNPAPYVTGLYLDLLHRLPGAAEVAGWSGLLEHGTTRNQVASAFVNSTEYRVNEILGFYRTI